LRMAEPMSAAIDDARGAGRPPPSRIRSMFVAAGDWVAV
jgi:hypothetical protein